MPEQFVSYGKPPQICKQNNLARRATAERPYINSIAVKERFSEQRGSIDFSLCGLECAQTKVYATSLLFFFFPFICPFTLLTDSFGVNLPPHILKKQFVGYAFIVFDK